VCLLLLGVLTDGEVGLDSGPSGAERACLLVQRVNGGADVLLSDAVRHVFRFAARNHRVSPGVFARVILAWCNLAEEGHQGKAP
jgi:hypothetical protein